MYFSGCCYLYGRASDFCRLFCARLLWENMSIAAWFSMASSPFCFLMPAAHEAPKGNSYHLPARPHYPTDWNNFLQDPRYLWNPQRVLWQPLPQSSELGQQCYPWPSLPEAGEWPLFHLVFYFCILSLYAEPTLVVLGQILHWTIGKFPSVYISLASQGHALGDTRVSCRPLC